MKKIIVSFFLVVLLVGVSAPTAPVAAQSETGERVVLQQQIISLLQKLISLLGGGTSSMTEDKMMKDGDSMMMKDGKYSLTFDTDLADLSEGYYEGWLIVGDEKVSTGLFQEGGEQTFHFDTDPESIDTVVITIEPEVDTDPGPSAVKVLAGPVVDGQAELAFPVDFSDASGSVILATPTDGENNNETSGVWFLSVPGPEASLELPELPAGWVYEGWAVYEGNPLTTGRFTDVAAADDFDGYSGPDAGPNYPGEDFIQNAPEGIDFPIDLADGTSKIVISVEPDIDGVDPTGTGPAQVKPLLVAVAEGQDDHENIDLDLNLSSVPSGTAMLK